MVLIPAILMTIGVIIVGVLLYLFLRYWRGVYQIAPMRWNLDSLYNGIVEQVGERFSLLDRLLYDRLFTGIILFIFSCSSSY